MNVPKLNYQNVLEGGKKTFEFENDLFQAFSNIGFVVLENHPISEALQEEFYLACKKVFELPVELKSEYQIPGFMGQRGYCGFAQEIAKDAEFHDLKEFWHIGRNPIPGDFRTESYLPNVFPSEIPEFEELSLSLFFELEKVAQELLTSLTRFLNLDSNYFHSSVNVGNSILRALRYPEYNVKNTNFEGSVRAFEHTDINLITLLIGASQKGLQVQSLDGQWYDVESKKNELVVNVGDMLSVLSGGDFKSTVHRVLDCEVDSNGNVLERYSFPFFCHLSNDFDLTLNGTNMLPPEIPSTAGEFLLKRLQEIGLIDK